MTTQELIVDFEKETIAEIAKRVSEETLFNHKRYAPTKLQIRTENYDSSFVPAGVEAPSYGYKLLLDTLSDELSKYFDKNSINVQYLNKDCFSILVTNTLITD